MNPAQVENNRYTNNYQPVQQDPYLNINSNNDPNRNYNSQNAYFSNPSAANNEIPPFNSASNNQQFGSNPVQNIGLLGQRGRPNNNDYNFQN